MKKKFKMPRKQKKGFKKWMTGVRGIFPDPTNANITAQHILEDMFSLYKAHNCLGKPLFSVGGKNGDYISEKWKQSNVVTESEKKSIKKLTDLINGYKEQRNRI